MRRLVLVFGLLNAVLFAALLPLWEGFDEAFHYSYVETLSGRRALPVLGQTMVARDVEKSLELAPVSHVVHEAYPQTLTFDQWFALPGVEKQRLRAELESLSRDVSEGSIPSYESHQPPLAYVALAPLDWIVSDASITLRVLVLRMAGAVGCVVLMYLGGLSLCRGLLVPERYTNVVLFTIFCSEMLYASASHVANDWLAIGISAMFFGALAERRVLAMACWLAAGLLTKAYFLVFLPLAVAVGFGSLRHLLILLAAGPWYLRNLMLYGNVGGTHEAFDGIGIRQALGAVSQINWFATAGFIARGSLWTGNNSFTTFSRGTLNLMFVLLFAGLIMRRQRGEWRVLAAIGLFCAAVLYATCASFADRHGGTAGASPWYTQVLLLPVIALAYLGMPRWMASFMAAFWAWVLIATWVVKLFPLYSGAGGAPMRMAAVWQWYVRDAGPHMADLSLLSLAPAWVLYAGMLLSVTLCVALTGVSLRGLVKLNET